VLQRVAACCSVLQCVTVVTTVWYSLSVKISGLELCCSVLQWELQCVAVCCSVPVEIQVGTLKDGEFVRHKISNPLQCVATCCIVLHRVLQCL